MTANRATSLALFVAIGLLAVVGILGWRSVSAQNAQTREQIAQVAQTLAAVRGETDAKLVSLAQDVGAIKADVSKAQSALGTATSDLSQVKSGLTVVSTDLVKLNTSASETSRLASTIKTDLASASAKLDKTDTQTQALLKNVAALQTTSTSVGNRVGAAEAGINQMSTTVSQISADVLRLQQAVAAQAAAVGAATGTTASLSSAILSVTGGVSLQISPSTPLAGQDVDFTLRGLQPWQQVTVSLLQPSGVPADWITEREAYVKDGQGNRSTQQALYPDESGTVTWTRIGARDGEGTWNVQLSLNGATHTVPYQVSQLQLSTERIQRFGLDLRRYQGLSSDVYFSSGVPSALVLDLQAHLYTARAALAQRLGLQSRTIPDLYLFADQTLFAAAGRAIGITVTWEDGFLTTRRPFPGIYLKTDTLGTALRSGLTHEYVHLLLEEKAPLLVPDWPAWVNEGAARYFEYDPGIHAQSYAALRAKVYAGIDETKQAAAAGSLFSLAALESQQDWIRQPDPDRALLQYAESYLAVRFLVERFSESALPLLLNKLAEGLPLAQAIQAATGQTYTAFEQAYRSWIRDWQDPERQAANSYDSSVNSLMAEWRQIAAQREALIGDTAPATRDLLVAQATLLQQRSVALTPPTGWNGLHQELTTFLSRAVVWLDLQRKYYGTGNDTQRVAANAMIPEINARDFIVRLNLGDLAFQYQLP
ncbi:MAG: hypothetical protein EXR47_03845 [Dehalococcoidia bacterium]|nr:hypothetical protein [Dehalococcoidia bacterium]